MRSGFGRIGALLAAIGIIIAILAIASIFWDTDELTGLLGRLNWLSLIILLLLAVVDHGLRYWRWELLLRRISPVNFKRSMAILLFSAGSLLIFTPARIGEAAKSVYTRDFFGIPVASSLPIIIVERLADMMVMALLASLGLFLIGKPFNLLLSGIILGGILAVIIFRKPLLSWGARFTKNQLGKDSGLAQALNLAGESQNRLLSRDSLTINLALGTSAWMVEVIIFFLSLFAVGISLGFNLFAVALAVFPLASLGGSLSFLPGGLGVTEGGITALGILLGGLPEEAVVLSAFLSRLAILGVVVLAGIISVIILRGKRPAA